MVSIRSLTCCIVAHRSSRSPLRAYRAHPAGDRVGAMTAVMWFRRDLRLGDNPALVEAAADGTRCSRCSSSTRRCGVPPGISRRLYLGDSLRALDASSATARAATTASRSSAATRSGGWCRRPAAVGAERVHVAADYGPYGARRDEAVARALAEHDVELVRTGSPYAVAPGRVTKDDGTPYAVFTPFSKAWAAHGWRGAGRRAARRRLRGRRRHHRHPGPGAARRAGAADGRRGGGPAPVAGVPRRPARRLRRDRDRPGVPGTSHMSRPPQVGRDPPAHDAGRPRRPPLAGGDDATARSSAWREFYADVLHQRPDTARDYLKPEFARDGLRRAGRRSSSVEARAAPASRSSTPGCASCGRPAGCTTGCG